MPSNYRRLGGRAGRFILVFTCLLVADVVVGIFFFARCSDAGESCSTANEWIDSVTLGIAVVLALAAAVVPIALIVGAMLVGVILKYRSARRRRGAS